MFPRRERTIMVRSTSLIASMLFLSQLYLKYYLYPFQTTWYKQSLFQSPWNTIQFMNPLGQIIDNKITDNGCHFRQWGNRDEQEHTMSCFRVGSGSSIKEKQEIQSQ